MVILNKVGKTYTTKSGVVNALIDIDIEFPESGIVFILGKSGCGKSTLLNVLGGLDANTNGDMTVNGASTQSYSEKDWDNYRNNNIGFIFQEYNLIDEYNVGANIAIAGQLQGHGKKENEQVVESALKAVGLEGYAMRKTSELSGGQKQRIAIARAIAKETKIILADEPTGNLDSENSKEIMQLLSRISKEKLVVVVTHDKENAEIFADRIIELADGRIVSDRHLSLEKGLKAEQNCSNENAQKESKEKLIFWPSPKDIGCTPKKQKQQHISVASLTLLSFRNLWKKKWRLIVAAILFFFTLALFGLGVSAFDFNDELLIYEVYEKYDVKEVKVHKKRANIGDNTKFTKEEIAEFGKKFPGYTFLPKYERIVHGKFVTEDESVENNPLNPGIPSQRKFEVDNVTYINDSILNSYGYRLVEGGRLPANKDEMCISKNYADYLMQTNRVRAVSYKEFCEKFSYESTFSLQNEPKKIKLTGIVDTLAKENYDKIAAAQDKSFADEYESASSRLELALSDEFKMSLSASLMMNEDFFEEGSGYSLYKDEIDFSFSTPSPVFRDDDEITPDASMQMGHDNLKIVSKQYFDKHDNDFDIVYADGVTAIGKNELIVNKKFLKGLVRAEGIVADDDAIKQFLNKGVEIEKYDKRGDASDDLLKYKVVGYFYDSNELHEAKLIAVGNDEQLKDYQNEAAGIMAVTTAFKGDKQTDQQLIKLFNSKKYKLTSFIELDINKALASSHAGKVGGGYFALGFGVFAILMMLNLITSSIKTSTKQIGILRASGMGSSGIAHIFLTEALSVGIIAFIAAVGAVFPLVNLVESQAAGPDRSEFVYIKGLYISPYAILAMFGLSILICLAGSLYPVLKRCHVPPIKLLKD